MTYNKHLPPLPASGYLRGRKAFGDEFLPVPLRVSQIKDLTPGAKLLLGAMLKIAGDTGQLARWYCPRKGHEDDETRALSALVGVTRNTVFRYIAELKAAHLIEVTQRGPGKAPLIRFPAAGLQYVSEDEARRGKLGIASALKPVPILQPHDKPAVPNVGPSHPHVGSEAIPTLGSSGITREASNERTIRENFSPSERDKETAGRDEPIARVRAHEIALLSTTDGDDQGVAIAIRSLEEKGIPITAHLREVVDGWLEDGIRPSWIPKAVKATRDKKVGAAYIGTILNRWLREGGPPASALEGNNLPALDFATAEWIPNSPPLIPGNGSALRRERHALELEQAREQRAPVPTEAVA